MTDKLKSCRCGNDDVMTADVCESLENLQILFAEIKCGECGFFMQLPTEEDVCKAWNICNTRTQLDNIKGEPNGDKLIAYDNWYRLEYNIALSEDTTLSTGHQQGFKAFMAGCSYTPVQHIKDQGLVKEIDNSLELCDYNITTTKDLVNDIEDDIASPTCKKTLGYGVDMIRHRTAIIKAALNKCKIALSQPIKDEWKDISNMLEGEKVMLGAYSNGKWYETLGKSKRTNIPCGFRQYVLPTHFRALPTPPN